MKIALNVLSAQTGGGVSVLVNLLPHLARIDTENLYTVFYSLKQQGFVEAIPKRFRKVAVRGVPRNPYIRVFWEQSVFPFYLLWNRVEVLYSLGNTTSIFAPCKIVLLMENANPYSLINLSWSRKDWLRLALLRVLGWFSARRATKIRFVSQNSKNLIVPQLKVSPEKCAVIPHGVFQKLPLSAGEGRGEGKSYLLTIGVNGSHRNTARLLKAFSILVNQYEYKGNLIIVGNTGSAQYRQALDNLVQELGLSQRVRFEGEVPHHRISSYFEHADVFVFPSVEETFGISLIEAMGFGVPIAASDCDLDVAYKGRCFNPFREICGEAAHYFNPFDVEDIAQAIHCVVTNTELRKQLIARGKEQVQKYKLEDTARALVRLFENVYNQ